MKDDHIGPIEGRCFMGLNFSEEDFAQISPAIVKAMAGKSTEFGTEEAIVHIIMDRESLSCQVDWHERRQESEMLDIEEGTDLHEVKRMYQELVDALCTPSWKGKESHYQVIQLARRMREREAKIVLHNS